MDLKGKLQFIIKLFIFTSIIELNATDTKDNLTSPSCFQQTTSTNDIFLFKCRNLNTLQRYLDKAQASTTAIIIQNSNIQIIPGHAFLRFAGTMKLLDLHLCGIESADSQAFTGLVNLEKLILWGNKLKWIPVSWFTNLQNLRVLDLSFNRIQNIEYQVYQSLPNLENFFIDYNDLKNVPFNFFSFLPKLKKVKFGMNPLNWAFRVHLTWQLIYQKVNYQDDWENWDWFSDVIRECVETGQGSIPSDQVLECVTLKLVDFSDKLFGSNDVSGLCSTEMSSLLHCTSNGTNRNEGVRKALQGMDKVFQHMEYSLGKFGTM